MKLKSAVIKNYRGIKEETLVSFQDFNCIVGKNDVGKSTLLKAIDAFIKGIALALNFNKLQMYASNVHQIQETAQNSLTLQAI